MLSAHLVKSDADTARDTALTARMNVYYHERRKAFWSRRETGGKAIAAIMSAVGASPVAGSPGWLGYFALAAAAIGGLLVVLRLDRKVEIHATLAARYLIHAQDFERMMRGGKQDDIVRLVESFEQTERIESEFEGEPSHKELKRAQERVLKETGQTETPAAA